MKLLNQNTGSLTIGHPMVYDVVIEEADYEKLLAIDARKRVASLEAYRISENVNKMVAEASKAKDAYDVALAKHDENMNALETLKMDGGADEIAAMIQQATAAADESGAALDAAKLALDTANEAAWASKLALAAHAAQNGLELSPTS